MHQGMIDKLSAKSGADFDKAYIADMVKGHTKMLKLMKGEESSKDADLKDFATKTSDTVQTHLSKAEDIQKTLK
jgi:putative membrane protein